MENDDAARGNEMSGAVVFAMYRPHDGKREALKALVDVHLPTLRKFEMVTERPALLVEGSDGTFLEIFEWVSDEAAQQVHQLPEVSKIWEQMGAVADFVTLRELPEAGQTFPHFAPIDD